MNLGAKNDPVGWNVLKCYIAASKNKLNLKFKTLSFNFEDLNAIAS